MRSLLSCSRHATWIAFCVLFAGAVSIVSPTHAQRDRDLDEAARLTYRKGKVAFEKGDYEEALSRFRQAYELSPRPTLLYNIATALDRLRRDEETVATLKEFLEKQPDTFRREEVEKRIATLEATINERKEKEAAAEAEKQRLADEKAEAERKRKEENERWIEQKRQEEENKFSFHMAVPLALAGAALVAGGLSIWSAAEAGGRGNDYNAYVTSPGATFSEAKARFDGAQSMATLTYILWISAGTFAAAAAITALFTKWKRKEKAPAAALMITPKGAYLGARLVF